MDAGRMRLLACGVGLAVALGYIAWRWDLGLVWDDTCAATSTPASIESPGSILRDVFASVQGNGYRPLSRLVGRLGAMLTTDPECPPRLLFVSNGVLFGCLAALHFLVAHRFLLNGPRWPCGLVSTTAPAGDDGRAVVAAALFATFLLMSSTPVLTGGLVVFVGIQAIVPLAFCGAILCHDAIVSVERSNANRSAASPAPGPPLRNEAERRGGRLLATAAWVGLLAILFLGPWYREFVGLVPLLLVARDWQLRRRVTPLMLVCTAAFLHALFPTAIARVVFPELPLAPVFQLGNLGTIVKPIPDHISPGTVIRAVQALHWRIFPDLVSVLPPTAVILAAIGLWARGRESFGSPVFLAERISEPNDSRPPPNPTLAEHRFLWLWFALTFLPFLKLFKIQVHLTYALVPLTILIANGTLRLWRRTHSLPVRWVIVLLLLIVIGDHAINPWVVRGATQSISGAIRRQAARFVREAPPGTPVLCNALQIEDIRYFSRRHIDVWSLQGGTPHPADWVRNVRELEDRLAAVPRGSALVLDVRLPVTEGQLGAGRANYVVEQRLVALGDERQVDRVIFRYPFLDPLKHWTPVATTAWPGPPDLEYDFFRGPDRSGALFTREVSADYWQAKILGNQVSNWEPNPILIEERSGFNIVLQGNRFHAIPVPEGAFSTDRFRRSDYSSQLEAETLEELREMVRNAVRQ